MFEDHFQYRVRFEGEGKDACFIEADAPVDIERMRAFIAKTKRVFGLAENADIRVIELRKVTERHEITTDILMKDLVDAVTERMKHARRILEDHDSGKFSPLESYHAARDLFDWEALGPVPDEEQAG